MDPIDPAPAPLSESSGPAPLLLSSLSAFSELLVACLDIVAPRDVVEVGSETGAATRALLSWAEANGATVHCVEPHPDDTVSALAEARPEFHLIRGRSPADLPEVTSGGVWLLDGDHNHHTVSTELTRIAELAGEAPFLAVVHDTAWPCGRRDAYYSPELLPPHAVHPNSFGLGVVLGQERALPGGFRGEGMYAVALHEGGPRNGVLTAVEDYLATHDELRAMTVPCVFGLTMVFPRSAPWAVPLGQLLSPLHANPLLERLERNRIELYLATLRLQDELSAARLRYDRLIGERERRISDLETELMRARDAAAGDPQSPAGRRRTGVATMPAAARSTHPAVATTSQGTQPSGGSH